MYSKDLVGELNKNKGDTKIEKKNNSFSYRLGQALVIVFIGCIATIVIALTVKFIFLLF